MFKSRFTFIVFSLICGYAKSTENPTTNRPKYDIRKMLIEEDVIPYVLSDLQNYTICKVVYNNTIDIVPGQHLRGKYCIKPPTVTWEADNDTYHTMYLSASNRWLTESYTTPERAKIGYFYPRKMEWESWVIINIPGNDLSKGDEHASYKAPAYSFVPQIKERYLFLIYKQPFKYDIVALNALNGDQWPDSFRLRDFVKMYNLTGPIAVNYFTMQWDNAFFSTMSSLRWDFQSRNNFKSPTTASLPYYISRMTRSMAPKVYMLYNRTDWRYLFPYPEDDDSLYCTPNKSWYDFIWQFHKYNPRPNFTTTSLST